MAYSEEKHQRVILDQKGTTMAEDGEDGLKRIENDDFEKFSPIFPNTRTVT